MPPPKIITLCEKIYRRLLRLYPKPYRRDFGEPMAQLFRDQCRDAWQSGRYGGLLKLWLRTLPDLGKTSFIEQLSHIGKSHIMNAKHTPTLLLVASLVLGLLSFAPLVVPYRGVFMLLVMASALCNLAKAGVELYRPASEWPMVAARTFVLMFLYAMFMPAWAKMKMEAAITTPVGHDPFGLFVVTCLFANPLVTLIKVGQFLLHRLKH